MAAASDSRVRFAFGVLNALAGLVVLIGVFLVAQPRYWALDVPALLIGSVQLLSAVGLLTQRRWALRVLAVAAWLSLVLGLMVVSAIVLSMVFLRSIHGDYGLAGLAVSGLIVALLVPYVLALPALELLWLGRQRSNPAP